MWQPEIQKNVPLFMSCCYILSVPRFGTLSPHFVKSGVTTVKRHSGQEDITVTQEIGNVLH